MAANAVSRLKKELKTFSPPQLWHTLSAAEKLQALYGLSLDSCLRMLTWSEHELETDAKKLAAHTSARHDVMMIVGKFGLEAHRDEQRAKAVEELREILTRTRNAQTDTTVGTDQAQDVVSKGKRD